MRFHVSHFIALLIVLSSSGCLTNQSGEEVNSSVDSDLDMDGIPDEIDDDQDGDGWDDRQENECGNDPRNSESTPGDKDSDGLCDALDADLEGLLEEFRSFSDLEQRTNDAELYGYNVTTWQMENGGWGKNNIDGYMEPWDGVEPISPYTCGKSDCPNGTYLGTLDNNATTSEIRFISKLYSTSNNETNRTIFKTSANQGLDFILKSQYESGGWPQVYPERIGTYSNLVTFNDHAMIRAMLLIWDIIEYKEPFSTDIFSGQNRTILRDSLDRGLDFILKSQIRNEGGSLTVWCQQHDPISYEPMPGRPYELPSKSGWESVGVTALLLNWPDRTEAVENATWSAVDWFHQNMILGVEYKMKPNGTFVDKEGSMMWYRFYNLSDDQFFMAGRDSVKVYSISDLTFEMKTNYQWAGDWGTDLVLETSKLNLTHIS
tara:strand:- start:1738 stop:3033 length:1296 start_codon:yes stop_codon:yes gene_type:complete